MQYIVIALILILMLLCVFGFSCRNSKPTQPAGGESAAPVTTSSGKFLSQRDIQKQLTVIAESPPPKKLDIGAMCYDIAAGPFRFDYVCPVCGEKTLYALEDAVDDTARQQYWQKARGLSELEGCRRLLAQIKHLDIALDESQFCQHCSPDVEIPHLGLVVKYPDNPEPHRVWGITQTDLLMLDAAAEGKRKFKGLQDDETALKDCLPRLQELLGVTLDETHTERND